MNTTHSDFANVNPEVGAIIHLDHVNFVTPDHNMATIFFVNGLGLTRDPYRRADEQNMGVNVGLQQFHLPRRGDKTPPFYGVIGLVHPDIPSVLERLNLLEKIGKFDNTPYSLGQSGDVITLTTPFGYKLNLHPVGSLSFQRPLGIVYAEVPVPIGSAESIGKFYRQVVGAPVNYEERSGEITSVIAAGAHQEIRFVERQLDDYDTHSMHISYHVTHYNNLRNQLSEYGSLLGMGRGEVFFFDKIYDPDSGEKVFTIQNEVRSIYHPDFMRVLINRWPIVDEPFTDQTQAMKELAGNLGFMPGES